MQLGSISNWNESQVNWLWGPMPPKFTQPLASGVTRPGAQQLLRKYGWMPFAPALTTVMSVADASNAATPRTAAAASIVRAMDFILGS